MHSRHLTTLLLGASLSAMTSPAWAQNTASPAPATTEGGADDKASDDAQDKKQIVVTGTLLRGVAPVGSETVGLSNADIAATGATSTQQLLSTIPQIGSFGQQVTPGVSFAAVAASLSINHQIQITAPTLRDLGGQAGTLMLIDGHRFVPAGVGGGTPDAEVIPPGALERIEVVLDGGSSLYGADAVGGVINYITRRRFDGIMLKGHYGFADDYRDYDVNLTLGTSWKGGGAYISYSHADNDALYGINREALKGINWTTGVPTGRTCALANVGVSTRTYAAPGLVLGTFNACDVSDYQAVFPAEKRHSGLASFNQDLNDAVNFDVKAFYTKRDTVANGGPTGTNVTMRPGNFFYKTLPAPDATAVQTVQFDYSPLRGNFSNIRRTHVREWGLTPQLRIDLGSSWQIRLLGNYGESRTWYKNQDINLTVQQNYANGTTSTTAINPYDIASTPNKTLIDSIFDWQAYGYGQSTLLQTRGVIDGSLLTLPGGEVKVAAGAEYVAERYNTRSGNTVKNAENTLIYRRIGKHVEAVFAEIFVPIFGPGNAMPGFQALNLSASVRHDRYSDFGKTTNPKFGITWAPISWMKLRGSWSKSFNAPSLSNQLGALSNTLQASSSFVPTPVGTTAPAGAFSIAVLGSVPNLQPQRAKSWSAGLDVTPELLRGLRASVNYYHVSFRGQLARPPIFDNARIFGEFKQYATLNPTRDQLIAFADGTTNGAAVIAPFLVQGGPLAYVILDYRLRNLGSIKTSGVDFSLNYTHDFGFGSVDIGTNGTYQLARSSSDGGAFVKVNLDQRDRFHAVSTLGTTIGGFRGQVKWNHIQGYDVISTATVIQDHVKSYDTIDLLLRYRLDKLLAAKDVSLTVNVDNLFDQAPSAYKSNGGSGIALGNPLGRMIRFGISTSF